LNKYTINLDPIKMRTTDLFKNNRSSKRLNESLAKTFGTTLDLESFDTPKLEDARNKLRTQIHTARQESGFNETIENETLTKAQFMHDAIVAELMDRQEHIVDTGVQEGFGSLEDEVAQILKKFDEDMNEIGGYGDPDQNKIVELLRQGDWDGATEVVWYAYADQDGGELRNMDNYIEDIEDQFKDLAQGGDEDEGGETDDGYALASAGFGSDEDYESIEMERVRDPEDWDEGNTEPPNNFAVSINGKQWKVFKGHGQYADDSREQAHYQQLKDWARKKSEATGKRWEVSITGENPTESINQESAPPTAKGERMVKHIKKGYADDGKLTDKERGIAYATAWKAHNKNESIEQTGDDMSNLREGEVQQASAIVTAKTMVDRVSRWIEELSSMENDTLLQLGDSIRDEMGQEQAKAFISSVAPAIQQALENLKSTRETMATGVRQLTGEEQGAEMLGGDPAAMGGDEMGPAEPDAMNMDGDMGDMGGEDEFAAAEPAAGGLGDAGREQRESINRSSSLLKVLAG
jgi:hypothetical protein